jgi:hypothetical protein
MLSNFWIFFCFWLLIRVQSIHQSSIWLFFHDKLLEKRWGGDHAKLLHQILRNKVTNHIIKCIIMVPPVSHYLLKYVTGFQEYHKDVSILLE